MGESENIKSEKAATLIPNFFGKNTNIEKKLIIKPNNEMSRDDVIGEKLKSCLAVPNK